MKKMSLIAACLALTAPAAWAQAKFFEGFSLGANAEMQRSTIDVNASGLSDNGNSSGLGLQAQYSFALTNQLVLGVGARFSTGNRNAAAASGPLGADLYTKNNSAFELTPGYAITDTVLVFGKVSVLSGTAQNDTLNRSYSLSGMGYGLGLRSMLDKNMFFQIGYDWNKYNDVTDSAVPVTFTPKSSLFSLGVGYKF